MIIHVRSEMLTFAWSTLLSTFFSADPFVELQQQQKKSFCSPDCSFDANKYGLLLIISSLLHLIMIKHGSDGFEPKTRSPQVKQKLCVSAQKIIDFGDFTGYFDFSWHSRLPRPPPRLTDTNESRIKSTSSLAITASRFSITWHWKLCSFLLIWKVRSWTSAYNFIYGTIFELPAANSCLMDKCGMWAMASLHSS